MKIKDLHGLYVEELRDLYSAETQIIEALPKMAEAAETVELREAIQGHLKQTKGQVMRLETIFKELGEKPAGNLCEATKGLLQEGAQLLKETDRGPVRDAGIVGAAQRVEHYEMAAYGTTRTYASLLGFDNQATLLQETLDEETETNASLNKLAMGHINDLALANMTPQMAQAGGKR